MLNQPPSGGCVLKHVSRPNDQQMEMPAAFRRLCVETMPVGEKILIPPPAAFRRLCVETVTTPKLNVKLPPAAFRRLCVETIAVTGKEDWLNQPPSGGCVLKPYYGALPVKVRIPAAFRRLCVETPFRLSFSFSPEPAAFRRLCVET